MSELKQQIEKKAVDLGDELRDNLALDSIAKAQIIKSLRELESFVSGLLPNYVIRSKQEFLDELDKLDDEVRKSSHGWNILDEEEKIKYAFICELLDIHCPKCKCNDVHRPRVKAKGTKYECLQCGETW